MTGRAREDVWTRHFQQPYRDDAANPRLPLPFRVTALANGNHKANGHAVFKQTEVAKALGHVDEDGHHVPADRRTVHRAITQAIDFGFLAKGSGALCLIVPRHRVSGGLGDPDAPCKRHRKGAQPLGRNVDRGP